MKNLTAIILALLTAILFLAACNQEPVGEAKGYSGNIWTVCSDHDNGKNYSTASSARKGFSDKNDTCLNETTLKEYYCEDNKLLIEKYDCSKLFGICEDGACVGMNRTNQTSNETNITNIITIGNQTIINSSYMTIINISLNESINLSLTNMTLLTNMTRIMTLADINTSENSCGISIDGDIVWIEYHLSKIINDGLNVTINNIDNTSCRFIIYFNSNLLIQKIDLYKSD